jgi:hypothetical protein
VWPRRYWSPCGTRTDTAGAAPFRCSFRVHNVHMTKDHPDWRKLNINLHVETMAVLQALAAKRHTTVTETVRRGAVVLAIVEGIDELPNQALAVVTKDPKTGEVTEIREVLVVG